MVALPFDGFESEIRLMTAFHFQELRTSAPAVLECVSAFFAELDETFPDGFDPGPPETWGLEKLDPPHGAFLVAFDAGRNAVGCVGVSLLSPEVAEVKRLWLHPDCRGKGLGRDLMLAIQDKAVSLGAKRLVLDTSRHLPGAVSFYRRAGWREIERYNDNPYAHHFFERALYSP